MSSSNNDDRRKFLLQSGAAVGGFLLNPTAGVLGLVAATLAQKNASDESNAKAAPGARTKRPLLRSAAPIDTAGRPFGARVASLSALQVPQALQKEDEAGRFVLVCGHESGPISLSTFEVVRSKRGWDHAVGSHYNRTFSRLTQVPIDGARLSAESSLYRHQAMLSGLGPARSSLTTPWNTVLIAEGGEGNDFGWVAELNPFTGSVIKRFSLGRLQALGLAQWTQSGSPYVLYALGGASGERMFLYKFVSHQRFDAKHLTANATLLSMGELYVADLEKAEWQPLSNGLDSNHWKALMQTPAAVTGSLKPLLFPYAFHVIEGSLLVLQDTEVTVVKERGLPHESAGFALERETGSPEKYASLAKPELNAGQFGVEHDGDQSIVFSFC